MRARGLRQTFAIATVFAAMVTSAGCGGSDEQEAGGSGTKAAGTETTDTAAGGAQSGGSESGVKAKDLVAEGGMASSMSSEGPGGHRFVSTGALVTNPNSDLAAYDVEVLFNLESADGKVIASESGDIPYIPAGATVPAAPLLPFMDIEEEPASLEVRASGTFEEDKGWKGVEEFSLTSAVELQVTDAALSRGTIGTKLTAQVTNPSDEPAKMSTWMCVFKQAGKVVGGRTGGIADQIPPKGTIALTEEFNGNFSADEVICRAWI